QLTYYNGSEQASTKLNINYCEILVDGKLAPYVVCTECFEVVARIDATGSGHDCKAAANDGKGTPASTTVGVIGRIDIPPPDLLSSVSSLLIWSFFRYIQRISVSIAVPQI